MFNVSEKKKRQNLLHVALRTLKETSRGSWPFTFSTKEPSACICVSILSHSGAKKQPSNLPAVAVYSFVCLFFYYSKPPHICIDFEPKQTCSAKPTYLQLKGGGGLWHGIVDKSVAERHKLVADDFDGLLRSRTCKVTVKEVEKVYLLAQHNHVLQMRNCSFWNNATVVTSQKCGNCVRLSCTISTAAEEFRQRWGDKYLARCIQMHHWRALCGLPRLTTRGCSRLWCWR